MIVRPLLIPVCRWLLCLGVVWLGGCALAPGLRFESAQERTPLWTQPGLTQEAAERGDAANGVAPVNLVRISPEIIAEQELRLEQGVQRLDVLLQAPPRYTIGPGDVLSVVVWDHPQLTMPMGPTLLGLQDSSSLPAGYTVDADGMIQFAYAGRVKVAGLTEAQARELLTKQLSPVIKDPQITLRVQSYRSQRVYVEGEVRQPGQVPINDLPMSLAEAIARSGGITPVADSSQILVLREGQRFLISLPEITSRGLHPGRLFLQHGDVVRVTSRDEARVSVMGEVLRPQSLTMRNGRLSLQQALADAGGLDRNAADARMIYVIRSHGARQPAQVFHLNARSPAMLAMAEGFQLQPRDVVFVDPAPLVLWNRVVSLILPTSGLTRTTIDTVNTVR